jgi:hypothetical protein
MGYPDLEGFAYSFSRGELSLGRRIYTAVTNVEFDQPTTEAAIMGTRPWPLKRTEGNMELGEGTVTFSDDGERLLFLGDLGNGWRNVIWGLTWILTSSKAPNVKVGCIGCRVLGNPIAHEQGEAALGGDISFSFMYHTINGMVPHTGLPAPTRPI